MSVLSNPVVWPCLFAFSLFAVAVACRPSLELTRSLMHMELADR